MIIKLKRTLPLILAIILMINSTICVFAEETSSEVIAYVAGTYSVTLPKKIVMDSDSVTYNVSISGDITSGSHVEIKPEKTNITLKNTDNTNYTVNAALTNGDLSFDFEEVAANTTKETTISLDSSNLKAGTYNGSILYQIQLIQDLEEIINQIELNDKITATLKMNSSGNGTLIISGTNFLPNVNASNEDPTLKLFTQDFDSIDVIIEEGITDIDDYAFKRMSNLKTISFPSTLNRIRSGVFRSTGLSEIDLSNTQVTTIVYDSFSFNDDLTTVLLPSTVTTIESIAFLGATKLEITLPENITRIDSDAFQNVKCVTLTNNIEVPENLWGAQKVIKADGTELIHP